MAVLNIGRDQSIFGVRKLLTWATFWISDFEEGGAAELGGGALCPGAPHYGVSPGGVFAACNQFYEENGNVIEMSCKNSG